MGIIGSIYLNNKKKYSSRRNKLKDVCIIQHFLVVRQFSIPYLKCFAMGNITLNIFISKKEGNERKNTKQEDRKHRKLGMFYPSPPLFFVAFMSQISEYF